VEFDSQPTPDGSLDETNVVAFSFTAGPVTIAHASPRLDMQRFDFRFDALGGIQDWNVAVYTLRSEDPNADIETEIVTSTQGLALLTVDIAYRFDLSDVEESIAYRFNAPGTWSAVPEPSTIALWLLAGGCGLVLHRRSRRPGGRDRA
jgi:hypothetical protein